MHFYSTARRGAASALCVSAGPLPPFCRPRPAPTCPRTRSWRANLYPSPCCRTPTLLTLCAPITPARGGWGGRGVERASVLTGPVRVRTASRSPRTSDPSRRTRACATCSRWASRIATPGSRRPSATPPFSPLCARTSRATASRCGTAAACAGRRTRTSSSTRPNATPASTGSTRCCATWPPPASASPPSPGQRTDPHPFTAP